MTTNQITIDRAVFVAWINDNRNIGNVGDAWIVWQAALQSQAATVKESLMDQAEPVVVGTKTWFEDGKIVVQNLTADEVYKTETAPPATQAALARALGAWTDEQAAAINVILASKKVSVSEVQRKLNIGYNAAQDICQSIVDTGFCNQMPIAPSLKRPGYAAPVAQQGWKLVPTEPTEAMCQAGLDSGKNQAWSYAKCYQAMLAAAPEAA